MQKTTLSLWIQITLGASLALGSAACLKTRAQLKEDDSAPQRVEAVEPRGGYAVDELKQEIGRLTGKIEELERQHGSEAKSGGKQEEQLKTLEKRMQDLENGQLAALEAIKKLQNEAPAPDATDVFQRGKEQLKGKHYDDAIKNLNVYLKNPNGKHAEEATFLRGEGYFSQKQYKKAIVDYSKFTEKYAKSTFTPKALLKIAQSFEGLGSKDDAHTYYELLIDEHPKSAEAKEAKKKIGKKKK